MYSETRTCKGRRFEAMATEAEEHAHISELTFFTSPVWLYGGALACLASDKVQASRNRRCVLRPRSRSVPLPLQPAFLLIVSHPIPGEWMCFPPAQASLPPSSSSSSFLSPGTEVVLFVVPRVGVGVGFIPVG